MAMRDEALDILKNTSRTFYIPISRLPTGLQEAVMAGYLCLRAIDEVEDHPQLTNAEKATLLRSIGHVLQTDFTAAGFAAVFVGHSHVLPEVTLRVCDWALLAPPSIAPRVWDATATMADRMAHWAHCGWTIDSEQDLDRYTFGVAGSVGLLLCDLWAWYNGTGTNRAHALGFGRGLQAVNILRNHEEDRARGVDFFPVGWTDEKMQSYARRNLALADAYTSALPAGPVREFCTIPLTLAHATLGALARGEGKLTRSAVVELVQRALGA